MTQTITQNVNDNLAMHINKLFDFDLTCCANRDWAYTRSTPAGRLVEVCAESQKFLDDNQLHWKDINMKTLEHYEILNEIDGMKKIRDEIKLAIMPMREQVIRTRKSNLLIHTIPNDELEAMTFGVVTLIDKTNHVMQMWKRFNFDTHFDFSNYFIGTSPFDWVKKSKRSNILPFRRKNKGGI